MTETRVVPLWVQNVLDTPVVRLNLWSIKFNASNIQLEGFVRNEEGTMMQKVSSEMICKRMTSNLLLDVSGRFYELTGQIDREFQLKAGMPKNLVDDFANGFPENWAFLINQSMSNGQRSARKEIEEAPRPNIDSTQPVAKGPIVTLADDTEMDATTATKQNFTAEPRPESDGSQRMSRSKYHNEQQVEKELVFEDDDANYTFRAPKSQLDTITPIRWERSKGLTNQKTINVFEKTPDRNPQTRSATSTPVAVPSSTRKSSAGAPLASSTPRPSRPVEAEKLPEPPSQESIFAVPHLPNREKDVNTKEKVVVPSSPGGISHGMLDTLESMFTANTPLPIPRRRNNISMRLADEEQRRGATSPTSSGQNLTRRHQYDDFDDYPQRREDNGGDSDGSLRDERGTSRMGRKRGLHPPGEESSDEDYYRPRKREQERERCRERYYDQSRYDQSHMSRYRERPNYEDSRRKPYRTDSSSSSRSVRFEDDRYSDRSRRDRYDSRYREEDRYYDRSNSRERSRYAFENSRYSNNTQYNKPPKKHRYYDKPDNTSRAQSWKDDEETLRDIDRREREVRMKLEKSKKLKSRNYEDDRSERSKNQSKVNKKYGPRSKSSNSYSDEDMDQELANEWDRENQDIMDNSMVGNGLERRKKKNRERTHSERSRDRSKDDKEKEYQPKPKKEKAKKQRKPVEVDPESISATRPRRACATPASAPTQKKVTWPRRDVDKLKRIIDMKKPTGHEEDWKEVTRLLAKDGVEFEEVKQIAVNRLKWRQSEEKEIVDNKDDEKNEEEEEKKRRKGVVAAVREDMKLREEMMAGKKGKDALVGAVDAVEEIAPADISADESLLGPKTPIGYTEAIRKKGGKRRTFVPEPVEDSPMAKSINSSLNKTPRTQAAKQKEAENTLKYVQQLATMQSRPGSRANKSYLNTTKNTSRGGKQNMSMSVDEGAQKALRMMKKGRREEVLEEENEEEEDTDDAMSEEDGENMTPVR